MLPRSAAPTRDNRHAAEIQLAGRLAVVLTGALLCVLWAPPALAGPAARRDALPSRSAGATADRGAGPLTVHLERVLQTRDDLKRGRLRRRLVGAGDPELFRRPFGVAWDGEDLVVTDPGNARVVSIRKRGRLVSSPDELFASPIGVAACRAGLVVSDSRLGRVALLDGDLRLVRFVAEGLDRPTGVACDGDRIFIVETGRHRVLALEPAAWLAAVTPPSGRVRRTGDRVFLPTPDGERVLVFEPDRVTRTLGRQGSSSGEFNFPTTISTGLGSLWVGDTLNFRLQSFDPLSGEFQATFGRLGDAAGEMPRLKGVAIDAAGRMWISDAYLDQVALYLADGTFLTAVGGSGAAPGEFSFPAGVSAHADGRVAVVDSLNRRLQVFRLGGPEDG